MGPASAVLARCLLSTFVFDGLSPSSGFSLDTGSGLHDVDVGSAFNVFGRGGSDGRRLGPIFRVSRFRYLFGLVVAHSFGSWRWPAGGRMQHAPPQRNRDT
jgi:hypothetical protein